VPAGKRFCPDAASWRRRPSGILLSFGGAVTLVIAELFHDVFLGGVSVFLLMLMAQRFFGDGGYALV
jgi:hypothetical protein